MIRGVTVRGPKSLSTAIQDDGPPGADRIHQLATRLSSQL
jgi:hypothetical protein